MKYRLPLLVATAITPTALLAILPAQALTLYVSPTGQDSWSGHGRVPDSKNTDGPFATLERARDEIRQLRKRGKFPADGVNVEIAGGVYELAKTFALEAEDSGTARSPIEYRARRGEQVRLVGGRQLKDWKPVTDEAVLARLEPGARANVRQINLGERGLRNLPGVQGSAQWGQSKPGVELFCQDKPMTLARWPNDGPARVVDVIGAHPVDDYGARGNEVGKIVYEGDRPSRWAGESDIWLHGFWALDWADQRQRLETIDTTKRIITLAKPDHEWGYRVGQWYYAFNILAELDKPGEWYLDHANNILYFWPTTPLKSEIPSISVLPTLVTMNDVSYVTLSGLTLEAAQDTGVMIQGGDNVHVRTCTIRNVGSWGVRVLKAKNSGVVGCDIYYTGDGGIDLDGGDRKTLTPGNLYAENNHIHDYSRWNPVYNAGVRLGGVGNRVRHNLIHDAPHLAIGLIGNDHLIEFNEIHSVLLESNDAGMIYAGQDWSMRGNKIRYNYLHHVYGREGRGCMGVYLDDNFSSATIHGNVFYQVPRAAFLGGGRDNVVENNLFIDCSPAINVDARGLEWRSSGRANLTQRLNEMPYQSEPWRSRYPELLTLLQDDPMAPRGTRVVRNIAVGGKWSNIERAAIPYAVMKDNFTEGDPRLADVAKGDFRLRKDSPAFKIGFKAIPIGKIGLYRDPKRATWPVVHAVRPRPETPEKTVSTP
ncbi:MAG: right-handed parallel beta-helix repeat-containing protein [Akkermansiaceae bacterium]|nr:right-handed parallel beta-helix repeat-containing protein [Armatimonadota bacterium]